MKPSLTTYGFAASAAYGISLTTGNIAPPAGSGLTVIQQSSPALQADGFGAVAFKDVDGNVIIAYEGTSLTSSQTNGYLFTLGAAGADLAIGLGKTPSALIDAANFARQVQSETGSSSIYVTGHSLGGIEAQAAAKALGDACAGGATFGATGLPDNAVSGPDNLINYVDYGDPVANTASDEDSPLSPLSPISMYHYGQVQMVGDPRSSSTLYDITEMITGATQEVAASANPDIAMANQFSALALAYGALANHATVKYAEDL